MYQYKIQPNLQKIMLKLFKKDKQTRERIIKKIKEMLEFLVKQKIMKRIESLNPTEKKIYDLTSVKGQTEIVKSLKVAPNTVSNLWKRLEKEGILIKDGKGYRKVV